MQGIFVIDEAGIVRASVGYENLRGDAALFGGFLSAIQLFVKSLSGDEVRELRFGELRLLIGQVGSDYVVTLHSTSEEDAESQNRAVQKLIEDERTPVDDGSLSLILSMLTPGQEASEMAATEEEKPDRSKAGKSRKSAEDWGKTVF